MKKLLSIVLITALVLQGTESSYALRPRASAIKSSSASEVRLKESAELLRPVFGRRNAISLQEFEDHLIHRCIWQRVRFNITRANSFFALEKILNNVFSIKALPNILRGLDDPIELFSKIIGTSLMINPPRAYYQVENNRLKEVGITAYGKRPWLAPFLAALFLIPVFVLSNAYITTYGVAIIPATMILFYIVSMLINWDISRLPQENLASFQLRQVCCYLIADRLVQESGSGIDLESFLSSLEFIPEQEKCPVEISLEDIANIEDRIIRKIEAMRSHLSTGTDAELRKDLAEGLISYQPESLIGMLKRFRQGLVIEIDDYVDRDPETANADKLRELIFMRGNNNSATPHGTLVPYVSAVNTVSDMSIYATNVNTEGPGKDVHWLVFGGLFNKCIKNTIKNIMTGGKTRYLLPDTYCTTNNAFHWITLPLFAINKRYNAKRGRDTLVLRYTLGDSIPEKLAEYSKPGELRTEGINVPVNNYFQLKYNRKAKIIIRKDGITLREINPEGKPAFMLDFYTNPEAMCTYAWGGTRSASDSKQVIEETGLPEFLTNLNGKVITENRLWYESPFRYNPRQYTLEVFSEQGQRGEYGEIPLIIRLNAPYNVPKANWKCCAGYATPNSAGIIVGSYNELGNTNYIEIGGYNFAPVGGRGLYNAVCTLLSESCPQNTTIEIINIKRPFLTWLYNVLGWDFAKTSVGRPFARAGFIMQDPHNDRIWQWGQLGKDVTLTKVEPQHKRSSSNKAASDAILPVPEWVHVPRYELAFHGARLGGFANVETREVTYKGQSYIAKTAFNHHDAEVYIIPQAAILLYLKSKGVSGISLPEHFLEVGPRRQKYILFEKIQGQALSDLIEKNKKITPQKALKIMISATRIIRSMLKAGVYHWDIKPKNIIVGKNGKITIIDFDFSFMANDMKAFKKRKLFLLGTRGYVSRSRKAFAFFGYKKISPFSESDEIYSLAATLLECLLGKNHTDPDAPLGEYINLIHENVPDALLPILNKAWMAGDAKYGNISDFLSDLQSVLNQLLRAEKMPAQEPRLSLEGPVMKNPLMPPNMLGIRAPAAWQPCPQAREAIERAA